MLSNENGDTDASDKRSALLSAIDSAHLDRVRKVLREICTESPAAFDLACGKLLIQDDQRAGSSTKRKREPAQRRYETCMQCKAEYDTTHNPKDACRWHEGETEPDFDGDFWTDHDEDIHGIIDSDFCRKEYPEGFMWNCCGKPGDAKGCMVDVHRPQTAKKAKV